MKVIIIGGVAAGMSAASKIKRTNPSAQVTVYEQGGVLAYGACGLPYFVAGYNEDESLLIARSKEQFEKQGILCRLHHQAVGLDPANKRVTVKNLQTGQVFEDSYDKLMLAVGAAPVVPPLAGLQKEGVFTLKTISDARQLKAAAAPGKQAVVVGGGYIGIETAEALSACGCRVTVVERAPRVLTTFEPELAALAQDELTAQGVTVRCNESVTALEGGDAVSGVRTDQGVIPADLAVLALGVRPATGFLADSGIEMLPNGAIVVDRTLRASLPDVWAAGDCAVVYNRALGENSYLPLGTVANKCGRLAGENICGGHSEFIGALGSAAIKVFDIELGRTGFSEEDAKRLGLDYGTVVVRGRNHPLYYPGSARITVKLVYEQGSKRLLGASLAGGRGAALRTDIFAVAIQAGITAPELGMTDLVYAPPFSGVWDIVNVACNAVK